MTFRVNSTAKASDDKATHIGERTDDTPGIEALEVSHVSEARRASVLLS